MRLATMSAVVFTVSLAVTGLASADEGLRRDFPMVGPYQVMCGDFHMHTINSDGRLTTRDRVEESKRLGYDVIAITDHSNMKAYRVAKCVGDQIGVIVIRGHESGMAEKEHYVVLGVDDSYVPVDSHCWAETTGQKTAFYQDQMRNVADHGGLIVWAHPHVGLRDCTIWGAQHGIIQGVELKNEVVADGWNTAKSHGTSWYPFALDWAMKYNLAFFADSDAHDRRSENSPVTLLLATERSEKGAMDAIRARRTLAWFNGMLWGRKELLTQIMASMVSATRSADGKLVLRNFGPIALKGRVPGTAFDLPAYGEASVAAGTGTVTVKWENVWFGLTDNIESVYAASAEKVAVGS